VHHVGQQNRCENLRNRTDLVDRRAVDDIRSARVARPVSDDPRAGRIDDAHNDADALLEGVDPGSQDLENLIVGGFGGPRRMWQAKSDGNRQADGQLSDSHVSTPPVNHSA